MNHAKLWQRITVELDRRLPNWRQRIEALNQIPAVRDRERGKCWTDDEIFKGLVLAVLSSCIDWKRIEKVMLQLPVHYCNFRLQEFATFTKEDIKERVVPKLKELGLGSLQLKKDQLTLLESAKLLTERSVTSGSLERYIGGLLTNANSDPVQLALCLGGEKSAHKLPGLRLPVAAEFLKNIGFSVAKADCHVCRALGSFQLVAFSSWSDHSGNKKPNAKPREQLEAMRCVEAIAATTGEHCCFVDNAIWLLCCKSGCRLTNEQLRKLAKGN